MNHLIISKRAVSEPAKGLIALISLFILLVEVLRVATGDTRKVSLMRNPP